MSSIDDLLSDKEKTLLAAILRRDFGFPRVIRLAVQYAIGAAVFVYLAISTQNAYWSLAVYGIFVGWLLVRILASRAVAARLPAIFEKYEHRIAELRAQSATESPPTR